MIEIDRQIAGLIAQALERDAKARRRESMRRSNSGPQNADHRARLRNQATKLDVQAFKIKAQLHAD
jgi:hypothetical protein